ncbi:MAG: hypothetical protein O7F71_15035 [Gammaproteobacteria bacterium]|nr:hypothetical protein [Gammaproteobacteria bacterium]
MSSWYSIVMRLFSLTALVLWGVGCAPGMKLNTQAPAGFNLSGHWTLVPELSDETPDPRKIRANSDRKELKRRKVLSRERAQVGSLMFITHDFPVLLADRMVIEQNSDSMGIEYNRGGYRDVSWGKRTRELWEVYTGWEQGNLVIVSRGDNAQTRETMRLDDNGRLLVIDVEVDADGEKVSVVRVFRRR